jgi:hypothetical protein
MNETKGPSVGKLAGATVFALALAAVVLVIAVLPAEYGIDPLGAGQLLGLTQLSEDAGAPLDLAALAEEKPTPIGDRKLSTPPVLTGWNRDHTARYKVDSRKIELGPKGEIEIKYQTSLGMSRTVRVIGAMVASPRNSRVESRVNNNTGRRLSGFPNLYHRISPRCTIHPNPAHVPKHRIHPFLRGDSGSLLGAWLPIHEHSAF